MRRGAASGTAILVCQGRAVAHGRLAPERFSDPLAARLLLPDERAAVDVARTGLPPDGVGARLEYERLRATADVMVPRTLAIDDAIRAQAAPQVVILGAGLDDRAWRMPELADRVVFEVDAAASQHDKRDRIEALAAAGDVRFVPIDLRTEDLIGSLAFAGHSAHEPTTWVWEGVVPYLTRAQVQATVADVAGASAPGSGLVVNYQSGGVRAFLGRAVARSLTLLVRGDDPMAGEPIRSTWSADAMRALLVRHRFVVDSDRNLADIARELAVDLGSQHSLRSGRVVVAHR
jgi:methyltransferase (TIGR00027 family)